MSGVKIKLRKGHILRTTVIRLIFYFILLIISATFLYGIKTFFGNSFVFNITSIIVLIIFILIFQYFIFAMSLNKNISFEGFKSILTGSDLDHPIKFLFPEFELFYKLEAGAVRDKIYLEKLEELAATNYINKDKTLQIETEFKNFISDHLQELLEYDIVIKMKRKGKAIFDDLVEQFPSLEKLVPFIDPAVIFNMEKIKNRKILIFDDSIHHSHSARHILDLIKRADYEKILFLTVVSQEESLESLKRDYPDVTFLQYKIKDEEEYKKFYAEYMIGYLDHVNRSLENDHTLIKLKIDTLIKKEDFIDLFADTKNYIYEVERIVEKVNEYKVSVECPWIYDKIKKPFFNNIRMDMVKVRFFIKLNQQNEIYGTTDINLSPALIPREFNEDFCQKSKMEEICILDKFINLTKGLNIDLSGDINRELNDLFCINCVINNLTNEFVNEFMKYFETILREKMKANIIEKNIFSPYPQEIYRIDQKFNL